VRAQGGKGGNCELRQSGMEWVIAFVKATAVLAAGVGFAAIIIWMTMKWKFPVVVSFLSVFMLILMTFVFRFE
jgi:hypothetical protein